jgi:mannitol 2-dehydrogenase
LTITEGGYSLAEPNPTIEAIVSALEARRCADGRPLTVLSCDNLSGNGDVARQAIVTVAGARSDELTRYVESACSFPNSMVDRITPQTQDEDRAWLLDEFGIDDGWPVVCESFRQWVIEDRFALARPDWQDAGVLFTDRVHDWERYKLRMLNAGHSCLAYLMALAGVVYVDEAVARPVVRRYLEQFLALEAIPTLTEVPGHPASAYAATVLERFDNRGMRDQIARLCIDGTAKFPNFLIPTVAAQLERDGPVSRAALALAAWSRYLGTVPANERAPDSLGERATALASRSIDEPLRFLELDEVFPSAVRDRERFREAFATASRNLAERGPIGANRTGTDSAPVPGLGPGLVPVERVLVEPALLTLTGIPHAQVAFVRRARLAIAAVDHPMSGMSACTADATPNRAPPTVRASSSQPPRLRPRSLPMTVSLLPASRLCRSPGSVPP